MLIDTRNRSMQFAYHSVCAVDSRLRPTGWQRRKTMVLSQK
jgi:hypothetical protein